MKVNLEMNEEQARVLMDALDLYSRIGMGQLHILEEHPLFDRKKGNEEIGVAISELKQVALPDLYGKGSSYGIRHESTPNVCRQAYDIQQVVRNKVSWHKKPQGGITVNFDEPIQYGDEPLPICIISDK